MAAKHLPIMANAIHVAVCSLLSGKVLYTVLRFIN